VKALNSSTKWGFCGVLKNPWKLESVFKSALKAVCYGSTLLFVKIGVHGLFQAAKQLI
jgi:hypothetical protein